MSACKRCGEPRGKYQCSACLKAYAAEWRAKKSTLRPEGTCPRCGGADFIAEQNNRCRTCEQARWRRRSRAKKLTRAEERQRCERAIRDQWTPEQEKRLRAAWLED